VSDTPQDRSTSRGEPGAAILRADVAGTAVFVLTAVVEAVVLAHWTEVVGVAVALGLFALGCLAFLAGYARAIQRSRADDIDVGSLFLLLGPAVPRHVKRILYGLLAVQVVAAVVTADVRPFTTLAFGVLVPVFGLGLNGLWAARHGRFPPRPAEPPAARDQGGSAKTATRAPKRDRAATAPTSGGDAPRAGSMEQNADHG
jgi:hypothetical protein